MAMWFITVVECRSLVYTITTGDLIFFHLLFAQFDLYIISC